MKAIPLILLLTLALVAPSPAAAGPPDTAKPAKHPSAWSRFYKGVAADWKKIGKDAKESGAAAGRKIKKEFQQMPSNFRKGFKETEESFKKATDSSKAPQTGN